MVTKYTIYDKDGDPKQRGGGQNDDAYVFSQGSFQEGSDQYKEFDKLYFQTLEDPLKNANKALDIIEKMILTLEGNRETSKDNITGRDRTVDEEIAKLEKEFDKSDASKLFNLDFSRPAGRVTDDAYLEKIRGLETQITTQMAPVQDLYEALTHEKDIQKIGNLMVSAREDINTATVKVYDRPTGFGTISAGTPEPEISTSAVGISGGLGSRSVTSPTYQDRDISRLENQRDSVEREAQRQKEMQEAAAGVDLSGLSAADFGVAAEGVPLDVADSDDTGDTGDTDNQTSSRFAPAPEIEEADVDEVYALLQEQFGGASYFFRKNAQNMQLGLTADGKLVDYNDPNATDTTSLMDYIVENGITSVTRVKGLLQKTEWWQTTDRAMRAFDATWGDMSEPERTEFLEPLTDRLAKEAQFLGFELSDEEQFDLAKNLMRFGDSEDQEAIREAVLGQLQYGKMQSDISGFGAAKDAIQQLAYKYYTPIDDATAQDWAEQIYTGEATNEEYEQYLKATAVSRFPTLDKVINEMGVTPDQYFSPYKYQIEQMLGRQVNMLEEFSDVIEFMPDTGTASRPMTLSEVRKFVRATPEWQQTDDAKDQARALAFSIGQTFGEVA
tara:strand:+ start:12440 stop:14278 length:1839 start_codon:yes stop_codon:yes gene_type:complete